MESLKSSDVDAEIFKGRGWKRVGVGEAVPAMTRVQTRGPEKKREAQVSKPEDENDPRNCDLVATHDISPFVLSRSISASLPMGLR